MITDRKTFSIGGKIVIEKILIKPPFKYQTIFQDEGCFLYVSGQQTIFHSPDQRVVIQPQEAVLLRCGSYFVEWLKQSEESALLVYAIHLHQDILKRIYRNELPTFIANNAKGKFIRKIISDITLTKYIESLDFYFDSPELVNQDLLELKLKELILILIHTNYSESVIQIISELFSSRVVTLKEVIENHLYTGIPVSQLAGLCNMSSSAFNRNFREVYNDSPVSYINKKRLERAMELIKISEMSVNQIAYELGFTDPGYFTRLFKKRFGVTPRAIQ